MAYQFHHLTSVNSTNIYARDHLSAGDVVYADEQRSGVGRRGRTWYSPKGNLYATMVLDRTIEPNHLPFMMALAIHEGIASFLSSDDQEHLKVKWPNDVLWKGQKLCGILIEALFDRYIVGFGVNANIVAKTDQPVTSIKNIAKETIDIKALLERIIESFDQHKRQDFKDIRQTWLNKCLYQNQEITARVSDAYQVIGIFVDIDLSGALMIKTEEGIKRIMTGDVFLSQKEQA